MISATVEFWLVFCDQKIILSNGDVNLYCATCGYYNRGAPPVACTRQSIALPEVFYQGRYCPLRGAKAGLPLHQGFYITNNIKILA